MKNFLKFLGIIAMVAVIGFSMAACSDDENGGDNGGTTGGGNFSELQGAYTTGSNSNLQARIYSADGTLVGAQLGKANMVISGNKLTVSAADDFVGGGGDTLKKDDKIVELTIKEFIGKEELSSGDISTYKLESEDSTDLSLVYTESWNGTVQLYFLDKDPATKFIIVCANSGNQSSRFIPQN